MKIGNMLYPESSSPNYDAQRIHDCMDEAKLSESLGVDALWLSEHHFDGNSIYSDPVTFASALFGMTSKIEIGFAVLQSSLYHPVRLAEQLALLDIISNNRLTVGIGRGTNGNIYEYEGYGINPDEAQSRYEEITFLISSLLNNSKGFEHKGEFWNIKIPQLRPSPSDLLHSKLIHSSGSANSVVELARLGQPLLLAPLSYDETARRLKLYKETMLKSGFSRNHLNNMLSKSWLWRDVYVSESEEKAEEIGLQNYLRTSVNRAMLRREIYKRRGLEPHARDKFDHTKETIVNSGFIFGDISKVEKEFMKISELGIGGVFSIFRLGGLTKEQGFENLDLFMSKIAPKLR